MKAVLALAAVGAFVWTSFVPPEGWPTVKASIDVHVSEPLDVIPDVEKIKEEVADLFTVEEVPQEVEVPKETEVTHSTNSGQAEETKESILVDAEAVEEVTEGAEVSEVTEVDQSV